MANSDYPTKGNNMPANLLALPPTYSEVIGAGASFYPGPPAGQPENAPFMGSAGKVPLPHMGGMGEPATVALSAPQPQVIRIQQQPQSITVAMPSDYLCYAIFTCLCCFWPVGIAALIRSCQCRSARVMGNVTEAKKLSNKVLCLSHTSLILGILFIGIEVIYYFGTRRGGMLSG